MGQPISIEDSEGVYFITTRTSGSKLWLTKGGELERQILACLARYQEIHGVILYCFVVMGNHYHLIAKFPRMNRAAFMRDFNSAVARLVGRHIGVHGRRSVWARRYACQMLPRSEDVRHWFFYAGLNPVSSGIVPKVSSYPSYNSWFDAVSGTGRKFRWINWSQFLMKKRYCPGLTPEECSKEYVLTYSRLPGYEDTPQAEYSEDLQKELACREAELVAERKAAGKGFLGLSRLAEQPLGATPKSTKTSTRHSKRPLVLTLCSSTRKKFLDAYFTILSRFKEASIALRTGGAAVPFPFGTYPPPGVVAV